MNVETYPGTGDPLLDGIFMTLTVLFRAVMVAGLLVLLFVGVVLLLDNLGIDLASTRPRRPELRRPRRELTDHGLYYESRVVWSGGKPVGTASRRLGVKS